MSDHGKGSNGPPPLGMIITGQVRAKHQWVGGREALRYRWATLQVGGCDRFELTTMHYQFGTGVHHSLVGVESEPDGLIGSCNISTLTTDFLLPTKNIVLIVHRANIVLFPLLSLLSYDVVVCHGEGYAHTLLDVQEGCGH